MAIPRTPIPSTSKPLFKVPGKDSAFNQFQDQALGTLNDFMKKQGEKTGAATQFTSASRPAASALVNGLLIRLKDPGAAEKLQVCLSSADGSFHWVDIVAGP